MSLTKRPAAKPQTGAFDADRFIGAAPDAAASHQGEPVEDLDAPRKQISLTINPVLLGKVDAWAKRKGMTRAGAFALAVSNLVDE